MSIEITYNKDSVNPVKLVHKIDKGMFVGQAIWLSMTLPEARELYGDLEIFLEEPEKYVRKEDIPSTLTRGHAAGR